MSLVFAPIAAALLEIRYPHIDPVALDLPGPIDVRWYGLTYLAGLVAAYYLIRWLARESYISLEPDAVGDLIFTLALGVVLGGRLGYILFYDFPSFAANPLRILRIDQGGMAFHGGLIGVIVAAGWFTRKHRMGFRELVDALALATPFGLFAGRMANFINGELYGRPASPDVPWAMRFPTDPAALRLLGAERVGLRERERIIEEAYESGLWDQIRTQVPLRHPSQLYQAAMEGVLLAVLLWAVFLLLRARGKRLARGVYGGLFLIGYGIVRMIGELFRQPDAQFRGPDDPIGTVLGPLTMGQTLSLLMVIGGIAFVVWCVRREGAVRPLES